MAFTMPNFKVTTSNLDIGYVVTITVFAFFKLMGLAPFSVRRTVRSTLSNKNIPQDSQMIQCSLSRFGCAYNFFLVPLQLGILAIAFPYALMEQLPNQSALTTMNGSIACAIGYIMLFMIWLTLGFRQHKTVRLMNRILSIDGTTLRLDGSSPPESWTFFLFLCMTNCIMIAGLGYTSYLSYGFVVSETVMLGIPTIICSWFVAKYIFVVKLIENRFRAINRILIDLSISSTFDLRHRLPIAREIALTKITKPDIATLRRTHANCCDIAAEISALYSIPILLTIIYVCYGLIYSGYYISVPFVIKMDHYEIVYSVCSLFWIGCRFGPIAVLAAGVTDAMKETKRTNDVVKNLLAHPKSNRDDIVELNQFLLELLHRDVQFTACGFFPLDCTLVLSIVGMVITYLIILLQFRMADVAKSPISGSQNSTDSPFNESRVK